MINYELKDNVVAHFPAIFKGLGSKPSVIHLALDVELLGAVLVARVAGGRPIHCGKCSRRTIIELARELVRRKHRVVPVEEACGFGYQFHRQLRDIEVEAHVVATEMLNRKRKTNRRDAAKLLDQLYDYDVKGKKSAAHHPSPNLRGAEEAASVSNAFPGDQGAQHHGRTRPRTDVRPRFSRRAPRLVGTTQMAQAASKASGA